MELVSYKKSNKQCQYNDNQVLKYRSKTDSRNVVNIKHISDNGQYQMELLCNELSNVTNI
jgi:hypothetical protein